jgi:hypothetical protein
VDRFISGEQCRRIHLDQEMDGQTDHSRCEDGEERCNVCQKDDEVVVEAEALRQAYAEEEQSIYEHDQMLDSGINMPLSIEMQGSIPSSIDNEANDRTPQSPTNSVIANQYEFQA